MSSTKSSENMFFQVVKDSGASLDQVPGLLDQLELRLKEMRDRCDESVQEELETVASCKRRVDHLMQVTTIPPFYCLETSQ